MKTAADVPSSVTGYWKGGSALVKKTKRLRSLDVRGLLCPIPILRTAQRMRDMPAGARLEVVGDDLGIVEDMPVWCEETGNRLVVLEREGELVRCLVEKAELRHDGGPSTPGPPEYDHSSRAARRTAFAGALRVLAARRTTTA